MPQASLGYLGVGLETTPGTGVAPDYFIPATDVSFQVPKDDQMVREIRGSRLAYTTLPGPVQPRVSFTTKVYPNQFMGMLLHGLFGGGTDEVVTTEPGVGAARKHVFKTGSPLPSLTFERSDHRVLGTGVVFERLAGHQIESMNFTAQFGQPLEVSVESRGTSGIIVPGAKPVSFTAYPSTAQMINFTQADILLDGVESPLFKSINFGFTNTFEDQNTLNNSLYPYKVYEGGMEASVTAEIAFEASNALYTKFQSGAELSLRVKCTGADVEATHPYELNVYWPRLTVRNFDAPFTAGEVVNASVEFSCLFDSAIDGVAEVFLVNADLEDAYSA